ncbi:cysteine dioxygenase [Penicillium chermesinum]|uniref:Cysteine dioxygenase n=1 Tax=Penicillium chermesinum TaxID=63820 RepID=A0A9W9P7F6_9EURO|nr:cysteine dioxygenase [Penicillium chermesinum]KAJ5239386.1 cysteine dioxygenase [Penicillium chermesinum]KAJ6165007.1 cysteine dioxygenase [Penicillium chermesinum]
MSSKVLSTSALPEGLAPGYQPFKARYDLESLVKDIKEHLGESGGISSDEVDSQYLISLARKYISDPADWIDFFHNDTSKNYTRNCIENINHKANILLLVWNPGKGSPIHDHADAHCIMKVLAGELHETVYNSPEGDAPRPLSIKSSQTFGMNEVTYISDDIGLHRVHNPSPNRVAVSLHLYTPPNAADYGYNIFDESTGRASHVPQAHSVCKTS